MVDQDKTRILDLELRVEKIEKKIYAVQLATNSLTEALRENSRLDTVTRQLISDHKKLENFSRLRHIRLIGMIVILAAFFITEQIKAEDLIESIIALTTAAGWWVIGGGIAKNSE